MKLLKKIMLSKMSSISLSLVLFLSLSTHANSQESHKPKTAEEAGHFNRCLFERDCFTEQWYVAGNIGQAYGDVAQQDIVSDAASLGFEVFDVSVDDTRFAYKLYVGTQLNRYWSIEAGYTDLGEVNTAFSTLTTQPDVFFQQTNTLHPHSADGLTLSAKLRVFSGDNWDAGAKLGLFFWDGEYTSFDVFGNTPVNNFSDDSGTDLTFGVGASWFATEHLDVIVDYDYYKFGEEDTSTLTLGAKYFF